MLIIPPNAVVLHREPPSGSARNAWLGTIVGLERLGARERVRVRVVGALTIVAEVTPAAVRALELTEGTEVWAAVKATEIEVFPT
jgi:molybdate transport system ATP-binding protein